MTTYLTGSGHQYGMCESKVLPLAKSYCTQVHSGYWPFYVLATTSNPTRACQSAIVKLKEKLQTEDFHKGQCFAIWVTMHMFYNIQWLLEMEYIGII